VSQNQRSVSWVEILERLPLWRSVENAYQTLDQTWAAVRPHAPVQEQALVLALGLAPAQALAQALVQVPVQVPVQEQVSAQALVRVPAQALGLALARALAAVLARALVRVPVQEQVSAQEQELVRVPAQALAQELVLALARALAAVPVQERALVQVPVQEQAPAQALAQELVLALARALAAVLARSPHRSKMGQALPCCRDRLQSNRRVLDSIRGRATPYSSRCLGLDPVQTGTLAHSSRPTLELRPFRSLAHQRA
jgi:hypothetical protein